MKKLLLFVAATFAAGSLVAETVTVTLQNASTYDHLYAWIEEGGQTTHLTGSWPGSEMEAQGESDLTLSFECEGSYNIIFNDGGSNQTADLTGLTGDVCYQEFVGGKVAVCGEEPETGWFIAGHTEDGDATKWCCGKKWSVDGCKLENNTVSYKGLTAGTYLFKVTDGTWKTCYGYTNLTEDSSAATTEGADNNIIFTLSESSDVDILFTEPVTEEESPKCIKLTYSASTAADEAEADAQAATYKAVEDGVVYIYKNGVKYNLLGAEVK